MGAGRGGGVRAIPLNPLDPPLQGENLSARTKIIQTGKNVQAKKSEQFDQVPLVWFLKKVFHC